MDIVQNEYQKDEKLKKEDVELLQEWLKGQPHLPKMTEQEVIWFLKSCYYSNEAAKKAIDTYFTMKTISPEVLGQKNIKSKAMQEAMEVVTLSVMPMKSLEGYSILVSHFNDPNSDNFVFNNTMKIVDMVITLDQLKNGAQEGLLCCLDMREVTFGHLAKMGIVQLKKFLMYLQDGMPIRLKGIHFFNVTPVVDKLVMLMRPFLKKEVMDVVFLHKTVQELKEFIPLESLSKELGGNHDSEKVLYERMKKDLNENAEFFDYQDTQLVDETKRPGKPKNASEIFGVEGTFKKLDID